MTRRIRAVGEAAVPDWVARDARRFQYPDFDTTGPPAQGGGGGGAFSIQVAAADAHDIEKEKADLVCSGVADQLTILQAANLLHASDINRGGRILLSSGTYDWAEIFLGNDIILQGMGTNETRLVESAAAFSTIETGGECVIRDLELVAHGSTDRGLFLGNQSQVVNVNFSGSPAAQIVPGNNVAITRCRQSGAGFFVDGSAGWNEVQIFNNMQGVGAIQLGTGTGWLITDNLLNGTIAGPGGGGMEGLVIAGNIWIGQPAMDLNNISHFVIAENVAYDTGWDFITVTDAHFGVIADNTGSDIENGILLDDAEGVAITDNVLLHGSAFGLDGIVLTSVVGSTVRGNHIVRPGGATNNTYDGIRTDSNTGDNLITDNHIVGRAASPQPRYGLNIDGTNNAVYANYLGASANYGTADSVDAGTGTQTSPAAGVIGGQFAY